MAAIRAESSRLICPAPTPSVIPPAQNTMALDLTYLATFQANSMSAICAAVGCTRVTTRRSVATISRLSALCISNPEPTRFTSIALRPCSHALAPPGGRPTCNRRTFALDLNTAKASSENAGAIKTSTNWRLTACAAEPSSGQLKAMMPPNADVGSVFQAPA